MGKGIDTKGDERSIWEAVLHYDYGSGYTNLYFCQHSLNYTLKITE